MVNKNCLICDAQIIDDTGRPMTNYRQYLVQLTDGFTTTLIMCADHEPTDEILTDLTTTTLQTLITQNQQLYNVYNNLTYLGRL